MSKYTGGSAFPVDFGSHGMTLRDYFAAKALTGILSGANDYEDERENREDYEGFCLRNAESAYDMADAMLRVRGDK